VRILATGSKGQLGRALEACAERRKFRFAGFDLPELDILDGEGVRRALAEARPEWVVHCAARTDVDGCESDPEGALRVNRDGAVAVQRAAREAGARFVLVSTDFVFAGDQDRPYVEQDPIGPLSAYGRSKAAGERACLEAWPEGTWVVRTQWLYGPGGRHFPGAILRRARAEGRLRVVQDQVGCPTLTLDLAAALLDLIQAPAPPGLYHASNEGETSWHGFALSILELSGLEGIPCQPIRAVDLALPARRPAYSVLSKAKLRSAIGRPLRPWWEALRHYMVDLGGAEAR